MEPHQHLKMNKPYIGILGIAVLASFNIGAEDNKKQLIAKERTVDTRMDACPRIGAALTPTETQDPSSPQHCLELNCGLGVYSLHENETVEKCSYCGSPRP